ncbi:MAG: LCP family protein [Erysipelotrichaceae bacterium]|nr:LCP family protein [Erysipelotrichaceae bacterium]
MSKIQDKTFDIVKILLCVLVYLVSALVVIQLLKLKLFRENLLWPMIWGIAFLDLGLTALMFFSGRKTGSKILCCSLSGVLILAYGGFYFYTAQTNNALDALTADNSGVKNVIRAYVLNDSGIDNESGLEGKTIGYLKSINRTGSDQALADLKEQNISVEAREYNNFGPLADALYNREVDAILVNDVYVRNISELSKFTDFNEKAKPVFTYEYITDVNSAAKSVSNITAEPFTVLINGSDSREGLGMTDRSDVNMVAAVNPNTGVVLLVSLPRDSYVETACDPEFECLAGQYDKLTHTGIHTYNTTKATVEKLMDISINYTFRANFSAVVDIVDALGGIDVNVAPGKAVEHFWTNDMFGTDYGVEEGINHLNGQAALCYTRERYAYEDGDFQRIRNQQEVLTEIAKKATSAEVIPHYAGLLDTIDGNFWTDISTDEISDLIQFQLSSAPNWNFISYSLSGKGDNQYCAESYNTASVVILDQTTVRFAKELIQAVLDGKTADEINAMIQEKEPEEADYQIDESLQVHDPIFDEGTEIYQTVPQPEYIP